MMPPPPRPTLFPYTTLFRSEGEMLHCPGVGLPGGGLGRLLGKVPEMNPAGEHSPQLRSEEHTSELQSQSNLVCRLLLEKKKTDRVKQKHRAVKEKIDMHHHN